ncbi:MAG TPA: hypothetical protein PKE27_22665 [Povalibacter sp.]|uniref:hypothetical protein n=1 Tax=Povalibacter sp. TaxID=1962978 RepID=UPI002BA45F1C|nr:hypothetical protein [Povalibacter sp.]HMN47396.1 hypothetical protein [Povalibacter sp.]
MTENHETPITLSREDLYELVWSKPMLELAKDFGISDVALAKRCRRLGIPVPGRGYWARIDAGQRPYRPKLPKREPEWFDQGALTVAPSNDVPPTSSKPPSSGMDGAWLAQRLAFEEQPANKIEVPATTRRWHATIKRCRDDLEQAAEEMRASRKADDRYEKWPEWRKRTEFARETWAWRHVKDRGQRLRDTHSPVAYRVSLDSYKRALSLTNALALAAASRGFTVTENEEIGRLVFAGHNTEIHLRITEMLEDRTRPKVRYDGKTEQERYKVPTGRLRVTLQADYRQGPSFEDRDSNKLESQLNRVFAGICRLVVKVWEKDRELAEFHRRMEESERRRAENERLRVEREKALAEKRARERCLSIETLRWLRSKRICEYVAHILATANDRGVSSELIGIWSEWALGVASELDPTDRRMNEVRQQT